MRTLRRKTEKPEREREQASLQSKGVPPNTQLPTAQRGRQGLAHITLHWIWGLPSWHPSHAGPTYTCPGWQGLSAYGVAWCCLQHARAAWICKQTHKMPCWPYIYIYIYIMILLQTFSFHSVSQFIANVSFLSFHIISQIPASQIFTVLIRFSCFTNIFSQFYSTLVSLCYSIFLRM